MNTLRTILLLFCSLFTVHCSLSQQYGWQNISANLPDFPFDTIFNDTGDTIVAGLIDLSFISDNEGWIVTSNGNNQGGGAVLHTMDGGETWLVSPVNTTCLAIQMLNQTTGYAGGSSGIIWQTTDGGQTWNFHGTIAATCTDIEFPPQPADTGYACGMEGQVCMITPEGIIMLESNIVGAVQTLSFPETKNEGWFEGEGWGMIRHFINGQWEGDQIGISGYHNSIDFVDNQNGWTVGDRILHTTNGYEWVEQTNHPELESALLDVCFININEGWAVGATGQVLKTLNGGQHWGNEDPNKDEFFNAVQFTSLTNGYVIGANKTILKYGQITGTEEHGGMEAWGNGGVEVFPNPTHGKFQITSTKHQTNSKFQAPSTKYQINSKNHPPAGGQDSKQQNSINLLEIMDLNGNVLELWNNGTLELWNFGTMELDISHLPAGLYFCRISFSNSLIVKKIVKF